MKYIIKVNKVNGLYKTLHSITIIDWINIVIVASLPLWTDSVVSVLHIHSPYNPFDFAPVDVFHVEQELA